MKDSNSIVDKAITILPNKLYFICSDKTVSGTLGNAFEFNIDQVLIYTPFNEDFGPFSLNCIYNYVKSLEALIDDQSNGDRIYFHRTSSNYTKYMNSILLICAFQIIVLRRSAVSSYEPFQQFEIPPFKDVYKSKTCCECTILHCLEGFEQAIKLQWFNLKTFNSREYFFYSNVANGDINQIVTNKLYAFSAPLRVKKQTSNSLCVKQYIPIFENLNITVTICLSKSSDCTKQFKECGIKSHCVIFPEDSYPSNQMINQFNRIVESYGEKIKIAVYCRSGMTKTAIMIGCYVLKHYGFTTEQYVGWVRLCRPGSVQGGHQSFLKSLQNSLHKDGLKSPIRQEAELIKQQNSPILQKSTNSCESGSPTEIKRYKKSKQTLIQGIELISSNQKTVQKKVHGLERLKKMIS